MKKSLKKDSKEKNNKFSNTEIISLIVGGIQNNKNLKKKKVNNFCIKICIIIILTIISIILIFYYLLINIKFSQIKKSNSSENLALNNKSMTNEKFENISENNIMTDKINNNTLNNLNDVKPRQKRIGVVGVDCDQNPGNNLIKYAMSTKLKEYGFYPIIIGRKKQFNRIDFLLGKVNLKIVKFSFSELNREDYDMLMINSDLCWTYSERKYFYDNAFLQFAENWKIPKFIYAASMGTTNWFYTQKDEEVAKRLLKNFRGISFREIGTAKWLLSI